MSGQRKYGFEYLSDQDVYLDSACQSMRPQPVIDALNRYYLTHNACGERVKYKWGQITDDKVEATRSKVLKYLHLRKKDYFVSFTTNTSYGLNLLINQIHPRYFTKIITSDIEHNSVFLSTLAYAQNHKVQRLVLPRNADGSLPLKRSFRKALVVVNCASNVDGRLLKNLKAVVTKAHRAGGLVILDAAQAVAHHPEILYHTQADAICFSAHKMYGASLGVIVARRDLLPQLRVNFLGGGMVDDVDKDSYLASFEKPELAHTVFEPGLQPWGEIIALGAAIDWLNKVPKKVKKELQQNYTRLYDFLASRPKVKLVNTAPAPVISFYVEGVDSHLIGEALGDQHIMVRTGYFCAHYYLDKVKHYPPLIRCSLGYHNTAADVDQIIQALTKVTE